MTVSPGLVHSPTHTVNYAYSQLRIQSTTHTVNYAYSQLRIQSTTHTVNYAYSQLRIQPTTHTVNYAYSQLRIQSTTHTVNYAYSQLGTHKLLLQVHTHTANWVLTSSCYKFIRIQPTGYSQALVTGSYAYSQLGTHKLLLQVHTHTANWVLTSSCYRFIRIQPTGYSQALVTGSCLFKFPHHQVNIALLFWTGDHNVLTDYCISRECCWMHGQSATSPAGPYLCVIDCREGNTVLYCISHDRCLGSHEWVSKRSGPYFCVHARSVNWSWLSGQYTVYCPISWRKVRRCYVCNKWNTDLVLVCTMAIPCGYMPKRRSREDRSPPVLPSYSLILGECIECGTSIAQSRSQ